MLTAVGHNLGGMHPFYDEELVKQGQIGGIMDYGLYTGSEDHRDTTDHKLFLSLIHPHVRR